MYTFGKNDTYKISNNKKEQKLVIDYKVLVRLYGPIIGSNALSIYLLFESEMSLNKNIKASFQISRLLKLLQIDEDMFNEAIETLKQYSLIKYKANSKKENDFLFVVYPTKTALDFFDTLKLNNSLQVLVDETYYQQVYDYFMSSAINEDEYVDIDEISTAKDISEKEFYEQFYEKYPVISSSTAFNEQTKKEISRLKKLFNLDYNEIENSLLNSFDYSNDQFVIDLNKLNAFVEQKFKDKNKESDEMIEKAFNNERSIAYYKKLSGRSALLPSETSMINELLDKYQISEGVLNVVINYYFTYKKQTMGLPKNYFAKIIEDMLIANVKNTIDAMNYFRNLNNRIKSYKNKENTIHKNDTPIEKEISEKENATEEIDSELLNSFKKALGG
ncbi:MAG: DnaD domain protein [Candidatus Caccosoma sp.]|nr:DnaD domain protein [Candidatus Caccosoma sp.]